MKNLKYLSFSRVSDGAVNFCTLFFSSKLPTLRRSFKRRDSYHRSILKSSLERKLVLIGLKFIICMILPTVNDILEAVITSDQFLYSNDFG